VGQGIHMPGSLSQEVHEFQSLVASQRLGYPGELGVNSILQFTVSHLRLSIGLWENLVNSSIDYLTMRTGRWQTGDIQGVY